MWSRILLSSALVLGLAGASQASTLFAGPISVGVGDQLICTMVNVGKKPVSGIEIQSTTDTTTVSQPQPLAPGASTSGGDVNGAASTRSGWCRFAFKGGKKSVLASACVRDAVNESCFAAVGAR